jgi:hypothetical protein
MLPVRRHRGRVSAVRLRDGTRTDRTGVRVGVWVFRVSVTVWTNSAGRLPGARWWHSASESRVRGARGAVPASNY